jgi:DNA-binding transcriptional ArsR family regulator
MGLEVVEMAKKPIVPFAFWKWKKIGLPVELWDVITDICVEDGRYYSDVITELLLKGLEDKAPVLPSEAEYKVMLEEQRQIVEAKLAKRKQQRQVVETKLANRKQLSQKRREHVKKLITGKWLSRQELAEQLGVTPRTISTILNEFKEAGIVEVSYQGHGNKLYATLKEDGNGQ